MQAGMMSVTGTKSARLTTPLATERRVLLGCVAKLENFGYQSSHIYLGLNHPCKMSCCLFTLELRRYQTVEQSVTLSRSELILHQVSRMSA